MRFFRFGSIYLISLLPLYIVRFSLFGFPSTLLEFSFLILWLVWVFEVVREGRISHVWHAIPLKEMVGFFLLAGLVSVLVSDEIRSGIGLYRAYFVEPVLFFILLTDLGKRRYLFISDVLVGLAISAFYLSVLAIIQHAFHSDLFAPHETASGRVSGVFNSANALALYLEPIIWTLGVVVFRDFKLSKRSAFFTLTLILSVVAIVLSRSMGGFVAFICLAGILVLRRFIKIHSSTFLWYVSGLFVVTALLIQLAYSVVGRMHAVPYAGPNTFLIRMIVWTGTSHLLSEHWITGAGLGGFKERYAISYLPVQYTEQLQYPHNIFLNFWSETGLYGLITFILLCYFLFKEADAKEIQIRIIIYGVLFLLFLHGLVDVPYFKNDLSMEFWIFASLLFFMRGGENGSVVS